MVVLCFVAQVSRSGSGSQAIGKALASVCTFSNFHTDVSIIL